MTPVFRYLIPALALMGLAACDREQKTAVKASADGEILDGSASDAMLPLDTVRSQAPLAPRVESSGGAGGQDRERPSAARRGSEGDAPAAADEPVAAPEPAEAPVTPAEE